jgi:pseudaminic acid synthase
MIRFVAELSGNHGGLLANALKLIHEAKDLGAEIKFQCFHPEALAHKRTAPHLGEAYEYETLRQVYLKTYTRASWWPLLKREIGNYPWSCSVFSEADVEFMEYLNCPRYKIASFELQDLNLIKCTARKRKPMVMSVNEKHSVADIMNAFDTASQYIDNITFLYATPYDKFDGGEAFEGAVALSNAAPKEVHIGLSDHSPPGDTKLAETCASTWLINMIERHLCLPGVVTPDSEFSDTPEQFKKLMDAVNYETA